MSGSRVALPRSLGSQNSPRDDTGNVVSTRERRVALELDLVLLHHRGTNGGAGLGELFEDAGGLLLRLRPLLQRGLATLHFRVLRRDPVDLRVGIAFIVRVRGVTRVGDSGDARIDRRLRGSHARADLL